MIIWTGSLLTPYPVQAGEEILSPEAAFPTSKGLHILVYAALTVMAGWLGVQGPRRWLLVIFLMVHGGLTECLQGLVPLRTGSLRDALLDQGGILLGVMVSWRWWRSAAGTEVEREPGEGDILPLPQRRNSA